MSFKSLILLFFALSLTQLQAQVLTPINQLSPLRSMPSLAGWHEGSGIYAEYERGNAPGSIANEVHYNLGADFYAEGLGSGFAINGFHSRYNERRDATSGLELQWSKRIHLGAKTYLSSGLSFAYFQFAKDPFETPQEGLPQASLNRLTFGASLSVIHRNLAITITSRDLTQPDVSFFADLESVVARSYSVRAMQRFQLNEKVSLTPTLLLRTTQADLGDFSGSAAALNASYGAASISAGWRFSQGPILAAGFEIMETIRLSYSYAQRTDLLSIDAYAYHGVGVRALLRQKTSGSRVLEDIPLL